jgi:hypothetical protein
MSQLTICTVNTGTATLLEANWNLTVNLNKRLPTRWVVVENTAEGNSEAVGASDERFRVRRGLPFSEVKALWPSNCLFGLNPGSFQHGYGLNLALEQVTTRWALLLDPDFCIVVPEWCSVIPEFMEREGLSFFGAPYPSQMHSKYRYFPAAYCLLVDLQRVPRETLDFRPVHIRRNWFSRRMERYLWRLLIGRSPDVGWRVYERYGRGQVASDVVQECFKGFRNPSRVRDFLRAAMPDRLSVTPKRKGYVVDDSFRSAGFPDPSTLGKLTDEYFWRGQPFGFHIRSRVQTADLKAVPASVAAFARPEIINKFNPRSAILQQPELSLAGR